MRRIPRLHNSVRATLCASLLSAAVAVGIPGTATAVPAAAPAAVPSAAPAAALPATYVGDAWARGRLAAAGIDVWSSGGCTDRYRSSCTSLEGMRARTVEWILVLKAATGCDLLVTGGTEVGHAQGSYSHWNGYRVDFNASRCLSAHVRRHFTQVAPGVWQAASGNRYMDEGSHWDVTFF